VAAQKKSSIPAETVALYEQLVATVPGLVRKGADNPYTSVNGNMFSLLKSPSGALALRLPADQRERFLDTYDTTLFEAYGVVMKEYVAVPDALLRNTRELRKYFKASYDYAKSLRPKPTTKPKKA
jgi:TfoX/Sxy family transcriptional regulator of competence genes